MSNRLGNITVFSHALNIDFMKQARFWIVVSLVLTAVFSALIIFKGVNYSIDFLGGTEVNFNSTDATLSSDKLKEIVAAAGFESFEVNEFQNPIGVQGGSNTFVVRLPRGQGENESEVSAEASALIEKLKAAIGPDKFVIESVTNISGKVGKEEEYRGYLALLIAFAGILVYIWYRFDMRFAPGAVACLVHDVIMALGIMTLLGRPFNVGSIAAFLTVIGYSMNDTVIVYDRIRETMRNNPRLDAKAAINLSINQTMNRTVLTASTAIGALIVLTYFGGGSIEDFALTMLIGIIVGTYSSIYVAAPSALFLDEFMTKRGINLSKSGETKVAKDPDFCPPVVLKRRKASEKSS